MVQYTSCHRWGIGPLRTDDCGLRVREAPRKTLHGARMTFVAFCCLLLSNGTSVAGLAERIHKIAQPQPGHEYSIQIIDPDSGAVIYSHSPRKPLIPASNMKLVTTATALKYLGPKFEYKTVVGLHDDTLVVIGSGDPLLGDKVTDDKYGRESGWVFDKIVQALREQGVREINDVIVDTTIFDDQRVHPSWPPSDYNKWYACEVCGLNYHGNCIDVATTNAGGAIVIDVEPQTRFVEIVNEVQATSGKSAVGSNRTQTPNKIIVFGKCKSKEGPFRVAIEQPAAFFGFLLVEHLARAGIVAKGKLIERDFEQTGRFKPLVEFVTPLSDVLERANTDSLGLAAEALLKTIAAQRSPAKGSGGWAGGRELVGQYLAGLGVAGAEFNIDDGSGLSRQNRLTTNAISKILLDLYRGGNWELFRVSLATGGEDGTIGKYFNEPKYRGRILGKTGYISGVRSFSGICLTDGGPYLFSIISNGSKGLSRDEINEVAKAIVDEYRRGR